MNAIVYVLAMILVGLIAYSAARRAGLTLEAWREHSRRTHYLTRTSAHWDPGESPDQKRVRIAQERRAGFRGHWALALLPIAAGAYGCGDSLPLDPIARAAEEAFEGAEFTGCIGDGDGLRLDYHPEDRPEVGVRIVYCRWR